MNIHNFIFHLETKRAKKDEYKYITWKYERKCSGNLWNNKVLGGFLCSSVGKEFACIVGDPGSIPGSGRFSGEGNSNLLQYPCHGQRSLAGYSPWGHKSQTWLSD